ncbi:MAG: ferric reductase-like transmembrane domain-containing protein [Beijerinckiaceae bacterium]|nr:ferric reductase-like transmembrane domain-containing protein [Beijerinckiaceae bacterium]
MNTRATPTIGIMPWLPFTDRAGRVSLFKLLVFTACCAPAVWMAYRWGAGLLSPKPVTDILRETGDWALRFLVVTLAVSPLRHATRWNRIYVVRRMLGLTALSYTLAHVVFWFAQENFRWMHLLYEAFFRTYLLIGVIATVILAVLGATSNDASVRRLGATRWNGLQWWVYPAALASLVHYFMLIRLDATQAALMAGFCTLFAGFRFLRKWKDGFGALHLFGLAIIAGFLTAAIEIGYYAFATGAQASRLVGAHLDFSYQVRPAWWVLAAGLVLAFTWIARHAYSAYGAQTSQRVMARLRRP